MNFKYLLSAKRLYAAVWILFLPVIILCLSCRQKQVFTSPKGYDLNKPVKYLLPENLTEISGIAFHQGKTDSLYAEEDNDGRVYYFHLGDKQVKYAKFGKKGDFEDMAIYKGQVIMLRSDGVLFSFPFGEIRSEITGTRSWEGLLPDGEYEGLCADEQAGLLYVLCKHCVGEHTSESNTGYILKLATDGSIIKSGKFSLNVASIASMAGEKKISFHPSGLVKNRLTKQWYILSSVNKVLVVADANWKVQSVYPLDPALFRQPEGITFDGQNNLYISNEGDEISPGNVLRFNYQK